jgi:hypothetical protein
MPNAYNNNPNGEFIYVACNYYYYSSGGGKSRISIPQYYAMDRKQMETIPLFIKHISRAE